MKITDVEINVVMAEGKKLGSRAFILAMFDNRDTAFEFMRLNEKCADSYFYWVERHHVYNDDGNY